MKEKAKSNVSLKKSNNNINLEDNYDYMKWYIEGCTKLINEVVEVFNRK